MWWKDPDFLYGETSICPPQPEYTNNAPEQRTTAKVHKAMNNTKSLFNFERFSQLTRLLNAASKVTKASEIFLKQPWHYETNANDLAEAKRFVYRESLKEGYTEECTILSDGEELSKKISLLNLAPFFDPEHLILGVGGRLSQGKFSEDKKFPPIISKKIRTGSTSS